MAITNSGHFNKGKRASIKTEFFIGHQPWNKGKKGIQFSTRKGLKQKPHSLITKSKISDSSKKDIFHWNWKGGISKDTNYNTKYRLSIIEILGFKCVRCGFNDVRALQIDHVNGGGTKERKTKGNGNPYKVILNKVIEGSNDYQILCANCNWIKKYENNEVASVVKKI